MSAFSPPGKDAGARAWDELSEELTPEPAPVVGLEDWKRSRRAQEAGAAGAGAPDALPVIRVRIPCADLGAYRRERALEFKIHGVLIRSERVRPVGTIVQLRIQLLDGSFGHEGEAVVTRHLAARPGGAPGYVLMLCESASERRPAPQDPPAPAERSTPAAAAPRDPPQRREDPPAVRAPPAPPPTPSHRAAAPSRTPPPLLIPPAPPPAAPSSRDAGYRTPPPLRIPPAPPALSVAPPIPERPAPLPAAPSGAGARERADLGLELFSDLELTGSLNVPQPLDLGALPGRARFTPSARPLRELPRPRDDRRAEVPMLARPPADLGTHEDLETVGTPVPALTPTPASTAGSRARSAPAVGAPAAGAVARPSRLGRVAPAVAALLVAAALGAGTSLLVASRRGVEGRALTSELRRADELWISGRLAGPGDDSALDHLLAARELAPEDPRLTRRLGALATLLGDLGERALARGDLQEAAAHFRAVLRADPASRGARERLRELADRLPAPEDEAQAGGRLQARAGGKGQR